MRMKAKTYVINFLVANYFLCFGFHSHFEKYINNVFCLYIFKFKNMEMWDELMKMT